MICQGRSGETSSTSSVPRSFSRESEIAVISADTSVSTSAISPGTNRFALSSVGLNRIRLASSMRTAPRRRRAELALEVRDHRANVALHRRPAVRIGRVGDEQHLRRVAARQLVGERRRQHDRDVRRAALE